MSDVLRSLAFALGAAVVVGALCLAVHGVQATLDVILILAPLGVATVLAAHAVIGRRERIGGLRRQFAVIGAVAVVQLALAVTLFVELMFVSSHDAFFTVLVAGYTGLLGIWAGQLLGRRALADLDVVRGTLTAVGEGRRDVRAGLAGSDELADLGAEVDVMIDRLGREERARRNLVAAVSHDLRTPLTSLQLLAEAVDDELVDDPAMRREYLARMGLQIRAVGRLIDDLFELSRLESGDIRWSIENVDLDGLVQDTVEAMRARRRRGGRPRRALRAPGRARQPGAAPARAVQPAPERDPPHARRRQRHRARAVHHRRPDRDQVADTGDGIDVAERAEVFDAFFQGGARAARTDGGAGLGLAIARAIVEAHGGRIWLEDAPLGTRIRFSVPTATVH